PLPKPRAVRTRVLFGAAGKMRGSADGRPSAPDDLTPFDQGGTKDLVFEIAVEEARLLDALGDALGFGHVASQGLFAGDPPQRRPAGSHLFADGLDHLDPAVVGADDPDRVHLGVLDHAPDVVVDLGIAYPELAAHCRDLVGPLCVLAVDRNDVSVPYASPALNVKTRHKPGSDDAH